MRAVVIGLMASLAMAGCNKSRTAEATATAANVQQIAWRHGDVDDAFAEAREQNKPVLLYWGAKWCPPCNAMKATLFRDPAFVAQTRSFVPIYLDGDSKGAQAWGERFAVAGYPTVIVLGPDRSEITRLSSNAAPAELAGVLRATAARIVPIDKLLPMARTNPGQLSKEDWQLLANYNWFTDARHFRNPGALPATLQHLAATAPDPVLARRFALLAATLPAYADDSKPG